MSCNGCRVLRKGCRADCSLGPCLDWIKSPDSQANATLFLAKFYGRAGLFNFINAGPAHLRPEIFRSLLYEACGRISNPVYGAAGLMCSGDWARCQAAVEAVLAGDDDSYTDIRHLSAASIHRARARKGGKNRVDPETVESDARFTISGWAGEREPSHDSFSVNRAEQAVQGVVTGTWPSEVGLELTLGRGPLVQTYPSTKIEIADNEQ